ncbi:MAG TPA: hypothetical protein VE261_08750 [Gaiellaceae bacterium]|nr:hypothetical protein [Gaiellaceae bacterium]
MNNDVIARLAAANPVPTGAPYRTPTPLLRPRYALVLAGVAVVAVPAVAFAGRLADALGISNGGTPVSTNDVLPGYPALDQAMQELDVGGTMQYLGTLNGVAFYATRNSAGDFCIAIDRVSEQYDKGFGCLAHADNFPSADVKVLTFPPARMLDGVAADGVATVEALDAAENVLASTPVVNNLFVSDTQLPEGAVAYIRTLDANGDVLTTQKVPG